MTVSGRHKAELRAGLFINLAVGLFILALFLFGGSLRIFSRSDHYRLHVPNAQGLLTGAKVFIAGVSAGMVKTIDVDDRTGGVVVTLDVPRRFRGLIREDSRVSLMTQGVLGDKVVTITPGNPEKPQIPPGGELRGLRMTDLSHVIDRGDVFLEHLDQLVVSLNRIAQPLASGAQAQKTAREATQAIQNLSQLLAKLNRSVDSEKLRNTLTSLDSILAKIDQGSGSLGALINDPGVYDDLRALTGGANRSRIVRNFTRSMIRSEEKKEAQDTEG